MNTQHYDSLEVRDPAAREAALMAALPAQIAHNISDNVTGRS